MSELEIVPEQLTNPAPDTVDDLSRISELIAGDSPKEPEPEQDAGSPDEPVDDAATPETEPEAVPEPGEDEEPEIDFDQVIPMPDGTEPMTVGQLKDYHRETVDFEKQRSEWETHRMERDTEFMAKNQMLNELAGLLGESNPEALRFVQREQHATRKREAELLLDIFPEWKDPAVKKAATPDLIETMVAYGWSEIDFAHLDNHRQIKALSDLTRLRKKEKAGQLAREQIAAEVPKAQASKQRKQSNAQKQAALVKRARDGNEADKMAAIGALIDGA